MINAFTRWMKSLQRKIIPRVTKQASAVRVQIQDGVAHVELNRPACLNALDVLGLVEFVRLLRNLRTDKTVDAIVLASSSRRGFCSGGDLRGATDLPPDLRAREFERLAWSFDLAARTIATHAKPIVAAVHGATAGAGLAIPLACDAIVMADDARFHGNVHTGLIPPAGVMLTLHQRLGIKAGMLLKAGRTIDARTAEASHLVTSVTRPDEVLPMAMEIAELFCTVPQRAFAESKRQSALQMQWLRPPALRRAERSAVGELARSPETVAAIEGFFRDRGRNRSNC